MSEPIRSHYVNWVDGMKMSKIHLLQLQQTMEDRLRDLRSIHDPLTDHGLLGQSPGGEPTLDLTVALEGRSRYQIELRRCRAVTQAGDRIELLSNTDALRLSAAIPEHLMTEGNSFDVILRASPELGEPVGTPDPAESPARHPFLRPSWTLEVAQAKELRQSKTTWNHIAIAKLRVQKDDLEQDTGYIPPALAMSALPQLEDFLHGYVKFLKDVERDLMRIVIKLNLVQDRTELQSSVDTFCRNGLRLLETNLPPVLMTGTRIRPREVVLHAAQFARTFHHAIELLTGRGKDALLEYVREHAGLKPAEYTATITGVMDLEYDHTDLRGALNTVTLFCRTHKKLFDMWVGLDYIGQKRDKDIFIAQDISTNRQAPPARPVSPTPSAPKPQKPTTGWDF